MSPAGSVISIDTDWRFGPFTAGCDALEFDESGLETVSLPHTVVPLPWENWDPATWERKWVYRRHFDAPSDARGMRVFVDFGAAMTHAEPMLNGHALPDHLGGYLPFSREITDLVRAEDNVLVVALDSSFNLNVPPNRPAPYTSDSVDYWQPGGLHRRVSLRTVPQVFLSDVFARPVDVLDAGRRRVVVECTVDAAELPGDVRVAVQLRDATTSVAAAAVPVPIGGRGQTTVTTVLDGLADIALWDIDDPNLYTVSATLMIDGAAVHERSVRVGFREATFRKDGFFLNGRHVKLFGLNRHHLYPFTGAAMPDRVQRRDAEILRRDLNCNMVRCSHYPQAEAFFEACDELGLMAWEEAPGWVYLGDDEWKEFAYRDVGEMIRRDRNHPSIIIWGARLNETDDDVPLYTRTRDLAHELDDSRPTVGAMSGRMDTQDYVQDVFAEDDYNNSIGPDGHKQPEIEPPRTDRPYMISEAVGTLSGPGRFYRRIDSQEDQQSQALAHARVHNIVGGDDRYCGLLAWSGFDYESGTGKNIYHAVKYTGVVDLFRIPKPGATIYQAQADPRRKPVIAPAFYWDFGPTSPVTSLTAALICSNLDRLVLYIDDRHFATVTPDRVNYAHLPYPPSFVDFSRVDGRTRPELRIDGYLADSLVASRTFSADPAFDTLSVSADDPELVADGVDQTRVVLRAVDKYGAPRPYVGGQLRLAIDGPATLIGANPFPFADTGGAGAVWLRTMRGSAGSVTFSATHHALGTGATTIEVAAPSGM